MVDKTLAMREYHGDVDNLYVIVDTGIDDIVIWQSSEGPIFQTAQGGLPKIRAKSLLGYLQQ